METMVADPIEALIERADFNDDDRDGGTGGFCAMFALALYRATISHNPTLVLIGARRDDKIMQARAGGIWWCHAAVKINGRYYDIEGYQKPEWLIGNYAWGLDKLPNTTGEIIELSPAEFVQEIRTTQNARDWRFFTMCKKKFKEALPTA